MEKNRKWAKALEAIQTSDNRKTSAFIVEALIDLDEDTAEIAADFIENEVGRLDAHNNWEVFKQKYDPVLKIQEYLDTYNIDGNPEEIVNYLNWFFSENPGQWK
jgi:hypothetical protein